MKLSNFLASLGIRSLSGKQIPSCFALFILVYDIHLLFFCVYIFSTSQFLHLQEYTYFPLSLGDRDSQVKCWRFAISYIYKGYLTTLAFSPQCSVFTYPIAYARICLFLSLGLVLIQKNAFWFCIDVQLYADFKDGWFT